MFFSTEIYKCLFTYSSRCIEYHLQRNLVFNFLVVLAFVLFHKVANFKHKHCLITECFKQEYTQSVVPTSVLFSVKQQMIFEAVHGNDYVATNA